MRNTVKLPFSPEDLQRRGIAVSEFEDWVRNVWIETESLKKNGDVYLFPAVGYAHEGWMAGYEAGYRAAKAESK